MEMGKVKENGRQALKDGGIGGDSGGGGIEGRAAAAERRGDIGEWREE